MLRLPLTSVGRALLRMHVGDLEEHVLVVGSAMEEISGNARPVGSLRPRPLLFVSQMSSSPSASVSWTVVSRIHALWCVQSERMVWARLSRSPSSHRWAA